jgi:hypothetical protein
MMGKLNERCALLLVSTILLLLPVLSSSVAVQASAAEESAAKGEIAFLIQQTRLSGCRFYRNGAWYDASAAADHLLTKYEYLATRGKINSAEEFIEKAASRSSLSGRAYQIQCAGKESVPSEEWFRGLLSRYREQHSSTR